MIQKYWLDTYRLFHNKCDFFSEFQKFYQPGIVTGRDCHKLWFTGPCRVLLALARCFERKSYAITKSHDWHVFLADLSVMWPISTWPHHWPNILTLKLTTLCLAWNELRNKFADSGLRWIAFVSAGTIERTAFHCRKYWQTANQR